MNKQDVLKKYLAHEEQVRVFVIDATNMVSNLRDIHMMSNVVTAATRKNINGNYDDGQYVKE